MWLGMKPQILWKFSKIYANVNGIKQVLEKFHNFRENLLISDPDLISIEGWVHEDSHESKRIHWEFVAKFAKWQTANGIISAKNQKDLKFLKRFNILKLRVGHFKLFYRKFNIFGNLKNNAIVLQQFSLGILPLPLLAPLLYMLWLLLFS